MEEVYCDLHPWGFQSADFDDSSWETARETAAAVTPAHTMYRSMPFQLMPRMTAPLGSLQAAAFQRGPRRRDGNAAFLLRAMLQGKGSVEIPAQTAVTFIVTAGVLTTGYPILRFSGGVGATIRLRYAESLMPSDGVKRHRDEMVGEVKGYCDIFHPDGPERSYQPFPWRTFRFLAVEIETASQPLTVHSLQHTFSAYPFEELAKFESSDPQHAGVWDICWRTARLCATRPTRTAPTMSSSSTAATRRSRP